MNSVSNSDDDPLEINYCSNWADIVSAFNRFPLQQVRSDGETSGDTTVIEPWIFRGHKTNKYGLTPSIERETKGKILTWSALEVKILEEFQSRARMHLNPSDVPDIKDKLSWLALMQHSSVPTRLLDFTLSPYVALYFAICNRTPEERLEPAEVWAINASSIDSWAEMAYGDAIREESKHECDNASVVTSVASAGASLDARFFNTDRDLIERDATIRRTMFSNAVSPNRFRRWYFNTRGFVVLAMPPIHNRRLSSQQGVFLLNGAENLSFQESLFKMMKGGHKRGWCQRFEIAAAAAEEIQEQLFRMNIHALSLFPDLDGLARFIREKARLCWLDE